MTTIATINGYLSVRTNAQGKRAWTFLCHNQPLCWETEDLRAVLTVARQTFGRCVLSVWDGDQGEFTSEMTTVEE